MATLGAGATVDAIPVPGDKRVLIVEEKPYGTVEVWDIRTEGLVRRVTTGPEFGPTAAVSPDGRRLATFGSSGMIWSLEGDPLLVNALSQY